MEHYSTAISISFVLKQRRALERGVTLIEVMIVVAIMAMVASGVALVAFPRFKEAQITQAKTNAKVMRQAVQQWQMTNTDSTCPSVSQLTQEKFLDKGASTTDPWSKAYQISCDNDEVTVSSPGPDQKTGTPDDIIVPAPENPEGAAAK